ncbi:MAG: hypothetical protein ABTQ34_04545 [Bdellovibrionales bacterium]
MTTTTLSPFIFVWFGLVLISSAGLYRTSDRVQHLDRELRQLDARIESEQQSLRVLKAEWIYLSNPARLEAAARKHLAMRPTSLQQITSLDQAAHIIPARGSVAATKLSAVSQSASALASKNTIRAASKAAPDGVIAATPTRKIAKVPAATPPAPRPEQKTAASAEFQDGESGGVSQTASAQPLPDSISALLDRMESHP